MPLQSHARASRAPECTCLCGQTFRCVSKSVYLVRNVSEQTCPRRGFGIQTACCSLELGGLSGSQGGSSFAERVGVALEVSRGCRRKAVEGEGKWEGGERETKKESTIIITGITLVFQTFPTHKPQGAHHYLSFSPLL